MDSFAQAAAYLQPSLEFVAKLSSIIPVWMMMVMADKHFLGLPLLGGSVWYSPRIPPRFTISSGHGAEHASGLKSSRHSASFGPSSLERGFPGSTIPHPRPFHALHLVSNSQPQGALTTTALTLFQTLEVHDPFVSSSGWLEHGYVGSAVLLVVLVVIISFVAMITNGRWYCNTSNTETRLPKLSAHEQLTEEMEFPIRWESILEDLLSNHSDETLEDSLDQPSTPMRANEDEDLSPQKMTADNSEKAEDILEEIKKSDQMEYVTGMGKEKENPEEEIPEMHNEENGQEEKTKTNEVVGTTTGGKPESCAEAGNENGSEAGKGAGKEYAKEGSKLNSKEDGPSESGKNFENEDLEISTMGEGIKKKKRRVRQNAKKRAAKLATAEETGKEVGGSSNASLEDPKQREDKDRKPEKVELEVVKPKASDALASAKSQKQDKVAGKEVEDSSNAFLEGPKQRKGKDRKSKGVETVIVEPEASDALAAAKDQKETEATAKDISTAGKGGGYSFKEADLHDATFVAADTAKTTSLPLRPPTPQPNNKPVPGSLPSKPQFTGLPAPKSSDTPQSSPAATANSSPGSDLLSSLLTRPKGSVPPLMPHHQSYGVAQSSSNGPSGQLSTPFQNIPGLNIPAMAPAPNYIPSKPGAISFSPDGPKPLFGNVTAQGGPKAGTDPRSKNAYFGKGYPSVPMFGNLPSGPSSNDAFKLPAFGPSAASGQSSAGPAKMTSTNQSIFQNIPPSSKPFSGVDSSSASPPKTIPPNQSISQNASVSSGQFTEFSCPSAATTNPPLAYPGSRVQKIALPPTPLSLGISQQHGVMPMQNAVTGAMNSAAGTKTEGMKRTAGPGVSPSKPRPMPKGRLGLSKPERPWPCARQADGVSYWQTGESVSWSHARQMNGKTYWR